VTARRSGPGIAFDEVGSGIPIVFIHGFPHNRTLWAPQLGALLSRARCVAPDLRGFGESDVRGPYSMQQYADDIVGVLDRLQIDRAVVAGLSMGGYIVFELWRRYRERVRALILADTRAGADGDQARARRRELIALARSKGAEAVADAQLPAMIGKTSRDRCPDTVEGIREMMAAASVEGIVGALEAMMARPDSTPLLPTIDVPTLIVVGEEDVPTPPKEARAMHERIPGSRLEILAGAGHVSNVERPAAFNHVVSEFLGVLTYA
jgi:pimeloyl-ACP methyl ester carboxylesterase